MTMEPFLVCICALLGLICYYCQALWKTRNYPPGPWGLPFFGNMLSPIRNNIPRGLRELGQKFGPIFTVKFGEHLVVVLDDPGLMKEALALDPFLRRPNNPALNMPSGGKYGITFADGDSWREQKSFALQQLVGLGIRSDEMEEYILTEVTDLCNWIKGQNRGPFSVTRILQLYSLNSFWQILGGGRFDPDDPYLKGIMDNQIKTVKASIKSAFVFAFPSLSKRFPRLLGWEKLDEGLTPLKDFLKAEIDKRQVRQSSKKQDGAEDGDFIEKYLAKISRTKNPNSSFYGDTGRKHLAGVLMDSFNAGYENTSTALAWAILYLATHQNVQKKLIQEIDHVIGREGRPTFSHKLRMPYAQAVILEALRCASPIGLTLFRESDKDVEFHGYLIPKGAYVTANIYSIHHNPRTWGSNHNEFIPERFLSSDGARFERREEFVGFGSRGRRCIGEGWSLDVMFLFLVEIFRRFTIFPVGSPSLEPVTAFVASPQGFEITAKERQ